MNKLIYVDRKKMLTYMLLYLLTNLLEIQEMWIFA